MDITTSTATPATNSTSSSTVSQNANGTLDYDTFLKLLIAQAKNQDPTNPTDVSQYIDQFSAMSQVEQSVKSNQKLDSIISSIEALRTDITALQQQNGDA